VIAALTLARAPSILDAYARVLRRYNPALPVPMSVVLARRVIIESNIRRIDPRLTIALIATESRWRIGARSPVGAIGLGQIMPATAQELGVDVAEPSSNIHGTVVYLAGLLRRYARFQPQERYERALAAYNSGAATVDRYHGVPPFLETRSYVRIVIRRWLRLCGAPA